MPKRIAPYEGPPRGKGAQAGAAPDRGAVGVEGGRLVQWGVQWVRGACLAGGALDVGWRGGEIGVCERGGRWGGGGLYGSLGGEGGEFGEEALLPGMAVVQFPNAGVAANAGDDLRNRAIDRVFQSLVFRRFAVFAFAFVLEGLDRRLAFGVAQVGGVAQAGGVGLFTNGACAR